MRDIVFRPATPILTLGVLALFSLGATPVEVELLRAVRAERLTVLSPKRRLLEAIAAQLAADAPWLAVETIPCPLDRPVLPEDAFDLVYSQACLHRLPHVETALGAIAASLRPSGLFAFVEYKGEDRLQFSARRLAQAQALVTELLGASMLATETVVTAPSPTDCAPATSRGARHPISHAWARSRSSRTDRWERARPRARTPTRGTLTTTAC